MGAVLFGFDPSTTKTGWAAVDHASGAPIENGVQDTQKVRRQFSDRGAAGSLYFAYKELVGSLFDRFRVAPTIYVEGMYIGNNRNTGLVLASASGTMVGVCCHYWEYSKIEQIKPWEWREQVGLEKGSSKQRIKEAMLDRGWPQELGQDRYDASAIAMAGYDLLYNPPVFRKKARAKTDANIKAGLKRRRSTRYRDC